MAIFSKQQIPSAVKKHSKLDVSGTHITSAGFMECQPVFYRHMIAGEHLKGNISALTRSAPVAVPCYGRCRLNLRSFFVPFDMVMPNFSDMLVDTVASNYDDSSLVADSPKFQAVELLNMFLNDTEVGNPLSEQVTDPNAVFDFTVGSYNYKFTDIGRRYYKILVGLGYQLIVTTDKTSFYYSALPLLCYAKVFVDYYSNLAYSNSADYLYITRLFKYNDPTAALLLSHTEIFTILQFIYSVCYDGGHDVYVNAWDNPVSPTSGNFTSSVQNDVTLLSQLNSVDSSSTVTVETSSNGTPYMRTSSSSTIGSQYIHDMLNAMTEYFKRNQLSGSLAVQRFLSNYGIKLDNKSIKRSYYLGSQSIDIDFGSVLQTADTSGSNEPSNLGDYAGVGFGKGGLDVDFTCDQFGLFLVIASIVPAADIVQGFDRNNLHINKLDFYNQVFDNLGCAAIARGEVYCSRDSNFINANTDYLKIFGFAPRFYEYKQGRSFLSGDFYVKSSWHLYRLFDDNSFIGQVNGLTHSLNFTRGVDNSQYDRIFQLENPDVDKFYLCVHAALEAYSPCMSLFETYRFENAGKVLEMNGNSASVN